MGRLVNANDLLHDIQVDTVLEPSTKVYLAIMIEDMETAYDADKVVEQISEYLNGFKECSDCDEELLMYIEEYITGIVEGAVKDETRL